MADIFENNFSGLTSKLPVWFKQRIPDMEKIRKMKKFLRKSHLYTICEGGRCPNIGHCWEAGTATFMILGDVCTRSCRFCAVKSGTPHPIDKEEPYHIALAVKDMGLSYVVITSVTRDDLGDHGAGQFVKVVSETKRVNPDVKVEILVPDFLNKKESLDAIAHCGADVIAHNVETVKRLYSIVRPKSNYATSLDVLKTIKDLSPDVTLKSSLMIGLGETQKEVGDVMEDLLSCGCDIFTIGQYLAPSKGIRHVKVKRFVTPEEFEEYKKMGLDMGLKAIVSGPLVRSSFQAEKTYRQIQSQDIIKTATEGIS